MQRSPAALCRIARSEHLAAWKLTDDTATSCVLHGQVMFTDMHLRELEPASWREDVVGTGSYGVVYRARWRGQQIAVKELKLPQMPKSTVHDTAASPKD